MNTLIIHIHILFFHFVTGASSNSIADSLYVHHYYETAYIEYTRGFYFHPEQQQNTEKRLSYARTLLKTRPYLGIVELNAVVAEFPDLAPKAKSTIAQLYLESGYYTHAAELYQNLNDTKGLGFTYLVSNDLEEARRCFHDAGYAAIESDIDMYIRQPKKSLRTASMLSLVCPGAGEIYAGNVTLGIRDFILNAGTIFLLYNAVRQKKYVDALLIFNFLFNRFYTGSIYNAQKTAISTNERKQQEWLGYMKSTYFQEYTPLPSD